MTENMLRKLHVAELMKERINTEMVIGIIGESCTGKSALAKELEEILGAEVYTGKDYLRLAKNEDMAKKVFQNKMREATSEKPLIYVISEKEHLELLPKTAFKILVTAELDTIRERFAKRMHGNLPAPVADMLERKHGCFDSEECDVHIESEQYDLDEVYFLILKARKGQD